MIAYQALGVVDAGVAAYQSRVLISIPLYQKREGARYGSPHSRESGKPGKGVGNQ